MVIIFCGVPGSGKSTVAKKLVRKLKKLGTWKLFVSDRVARSVYKKISQFLKENLGKPRSEKESLLRGKVDFIIIDATFYKKKWRDIVYQIAKKKKEKVFTIYLHCSLKTSLLRNKKRKPKIPEKAVHIIYHEMEEPKKPDVSIDTDKVGPEGAISKILREIRKKS